MHFTPLVWIALFIYAFLVAVTKTGIPGIGILVVVLLLFTMPAKESVGFLLPILIMGDIFAVAYYRRHAVWSHLFRLVPWAVAGILIGNFMLDRVNDEQLKRLIGLIVIVLLAVDAWRNRAGDARIPTQWWFAGLIGIFAGITTLLANAGGPLLAVYLLAMRLEKSEFIGTSAWYFLFLNCFKVPFLWHKGLITWDSLEVNLILLPGVAMGALAGIVVLRHIPQRWFVAIVKTLTLVMALWLLLSDCVIALFAR